MTTDVEHKIIKMGDRHGVTNYMFATKADMEAYTNLTELDLEKIARVADTGFGEEGYFILSEINYTLGTRKWVSIFGGDGVGKTNLGLGTITDSTIVVTSDTGNDVTIPAATNTEAGLITGTLRAKLAVQATNAELRDRVTHTGSQTASTIGDFAESVQDVVADMLVAGANMALIYNDVTGKLELSSTGGGGGGGVGSVAAARAARNSNLATSAGWNKVVLQQKTYDASNICDLGTSRITPKQAGWYLVIGRVQLTATGFNVTSIYKNGTRVGEVGTEGTSLGGGGSCIVYCNGTTDYVELYIYTGSTATVLGKQELTYIEVLGPITSGGGGGRVVDINNYYVSTDFLDNSDTQAIWVGTNIGSGSSANSAPAAARTTKHPGTIMVKNGTAVNTGWALRTQVANSLLTTANMEMNFVFKLAPTIVSGYATNTVIRFGFLDSITTTESTDAIVLAKQAGSLNLIGRAISNGTVADTPSIYTMVEQVWYQGKIKVGTDGISCVFSLYDDSGTLLGSQTLTSGLPIGAARLFGSGFVIYHSTLTTSQDIVEMDYMDLYLPNLGRGVA